MSLRRASCQGGTLLQHYQGNLALTNASDSLMLASRLMIDLVPLVEKVCDDRAVWGLTSHEDLILLARDDYESPWLVRVHPQTFGTPQYDVIYMMSSNDAPWPGARVGGSATTAELAAKFIDIAMKKCGAWPPAT